MKPGTALIVTACGPDTNPKESGEYHTIENGVKHSAFYNEGIKQWFEYEPLDSVKFGHALYPEPVSPDFWLKPVGPLEDLQREAWIDGFDNGIDCEKHGENNEFKDFRIKWTKKQEEK